MAKPVKTECKDKGELVLYGLWIGSNRTSFEAESENLMILYSSKVSHQKALRYVICEKPDERGNLDMFCGGEEPGEGLDEYRIPAASYVSTTVTPKFGFLWGGALDNADRYLRKDWPEESGRRLDGFRMEVRDMVSSKPSIEILYRLEE